ncbi:MAG TPA: hypothetical protein VK588_08425, partial [Chitinophagaceae bacterium]|nr:hypothetical protein [Chitinophagaceae bacterium]
LIRGLVLKNQKVLLISYVNGALHNELKDLDPDLLIVVDKDEESIYQTMDLISYNDIIITTHYYAVFKKFKKKNPKIIFYCVNITSLVVANLYFKRLNIKALTRRLVKRISTRGGLLFIDTYAVEENERQLNILIRDPLFLPIPVEVPATNLWKNRNGVPPGISFTYIGRAVDWKIFPVRKLLNDISNSDLPKEGNKIKFHIVTDDKNEFNKQIADRSSPLIEICFHENLSQKELSAFLLEHSCLHFAMGTSSLDGAKLGVPTILLDFSFEEFPQNYCYNFLYTTKGNQVGRWIKKDTDFHGYTIQELIQMVKDEKQIQQLSYLSYKYVKENHELLNITDKLIDFSSTCNIHVKDVSPLLVRYWIS